MTTRTASPSELILENTACRVVLNRPHEELGARFCKGGWLKELTLKDRNETLLVSESIFPDHVAFGFTEEYLPSIPVAPEGDADLRFKVGVGIVKRTGKSRFSEVPHRLADWTVDQADPQQLRFIQRNPDHDGFGCELIKELSLTGTTLKITTRLNNTGTKRLEGEVYLHPFFTRAKNPEQDWFQIPGGKAPVQAFADLGPGEQFQSRSNVDRSCRWVAVGNRETERIIAILGDQEFKQIDLWKREDASAIEPFVALDLKPGKEKTWSWWLVIGRGVTHLSDVSPEGLLSLDATPDESIVTLIPSTALGRLDVKQTTEDGNGRALTTETQQLSVTAPLTPAVLHFPAVKADSGQRIRIEIYQGKNRILQAQSKVE